MATQKIKCRACGFGALLFTRGESAKLTVDSAKQSHLCNFLKQHLNTSSHKLGALDCRDFREALDGPAEDDGSGSPTLGEPEIEAVEFNEAAPEKAGTKSPARSRKSRRANVSESEPTLPKVKSARRPPRKSTKPRKIHLDVGVVADGEPMVS
jgi:hypothetical protein